MVACLEAILVLLKHSQGDVVIRPDCNAAIEGLRLAIRGQVQQFCANAHWWHEIREAIQVRQGSVSIDRVDAHADVRAYIEKGLDIKDWWGNEIADHLAGVAADANRLSNQAEEGYSFLVGRATKILKRSIAINRLFMAEPGQLAARGVWPKRQHPVHHAIVASGHGLKRDARSAFQCISCGQRAGKRRLKEWLLQGKCKGLRGQSEGVFAQAVGDNATVTIGNKNTHHTHTLAWQRGFWFCVKCGCYSKAIQNEKSTMKNLSDPCSGVASKGGNEVLGRFKNGNPPKPGMKWTLEDVVGPPAMSNEALEALWPDLRGAKRKKRPRPKSAKDENESESKVLVTADPAEQSHDEEEDVVFNEDEDPWHERA